MAQPLVLVQDSGSDSDDPIPLDPPPHSVASRRVRSSSSQPLAARRAQAGSSRQAKRGRPRAHKRQKTPEDDDVVFVREEKAREVGTGLASRFAFADSPPPRPRHLSTCLPPAFRPPNPPPNLESLISTALEGPTEDFTLMRRRTNAAAAADGLMTSLPDLVPRPKRALRNTTVRASHARDGWVEEVDMRVVEVFGAPSRSPSRSAEPSPSRSPSPFQATQPLGESALSLSAEYSRPPRAHSPIPNLLPQAPPLIGLSQAVRETFAEEEASQTQRAASALSRYDDGLEPGDGFHFPSQRPTSRLSSPPQTPPRRFYGGGFKPFRHGGGSQPAGSRRHTAGIDPERRRRLAEAIGVGVDEARQRRRDAISAGISQR
ncbi:hypothetical protein CC85DRAFT_299204 [Cutaneotrichosporon oleaginosum]|uniref:Uncharacterized protein n=1 Tax=Cutaneotrichosporon oleaginosum TaxID=879819 RepID=A0A0J0XYB2_9TREE|nr:uncharacterized protein CC85DRAFT_299204 [Cutaneotrichosporon oleaginosum]KLT46033.1 hypothetical protein CC85DRAFT_299204 [Cutaneotrichosporon oleaginosum]TXT06727.1 hypothetical protein COLE_06058 [Cutaneotrichosporon oleaginosum]